MSQTDQDQEIGTNHPEEDHEAEEEVQTQRVIETGREVRNTRKRRRNTRSGKEVEIKIITVSLHQYFCQAINNCFNTSAFLSIFVIFRRE